jgi:serine/threonine protein kinase
MTESKVGFVMEYCGGGNLQQKLSEYPSKSLPEELAKVIIRQVVSAVVHIHSRGMHACMLDELTWVDMSWVYKLTLWLVYKLTLYLSATKWYEFVVLMMWIVTK